VSSEHVPFMINNEIEILLLITSPLSTTTPSLATISFPSSTIPSSSVTDSSSSSTASFLSPSISPSLASISSPSLLPIEVNPINKRLCNKWSTILLDHNYNLPNNHKIAKKRKIWNLDQNIVFNIYLIGKNNLKLNIKHVFDDFIAKYGKLICSLDFKGDSMGRHFCEKFRNRINPKCIYHFFITQISIYTSL
jgi:hypothetical protein